MSSEPQPSETPRAVSQLRREILSDYVADLGLATDAKYISGAPLRPVVPLDVGSKVFVLGAYPSARFGAFRGERDIPVADNLGPFERERYFDGERVRVQNSAEELQELLLGPLGVPRSDCWVTDLVKVFLFKKGHSAKYDRLGGKAPVGYTREAFQALGEKSLPWIEREVRVSQPTLLITLGAEVAGIVTGTRSAAARTRLLDGEVRPLQFRGVEVSVAHLPHPGILMREVAGAGWRARNKRWVAGLADWLRSPKRR